MEKSPGWWKLAFGIQLKKLHKWNAWVILALAVTGVILYMPYLRRYIAPFRVELKFLHIYLGYFSMFLLLLYVPLLRKHLKQIWNKTNQVSNLWIIIGLILGWGVSGVILALYRYLPDVWSSTALLFHDLFTYIGIPYSAYHAVSRSRWLKKVEREERKAARQAKREDLRAARQAKRSEELRPVAGQNQPSFSRRKFIRLGASGLFVVAVAPFFFGWLSRLYGGTERPSSHPKPDGNHMVPAPEPAPSSLPLKEGGGAGTFRMYTVTEIPSFSNDNWRFTVDGLVNQPLSLDWPSFLKLPRKVQVSDFHCVTGWSVYHVTWEGVPLSDLLKKAGIKKGAKNVKFYSGDGVYTDTLTLKQAHLEDVMVAVLRDGKPIPQDFGGPTRLIIPKMYGYKSVKWLNRIELIDHEYTGFWERRGYSKDAWYRG